MPDTKIIVKPTHPARHRPTPRQNRRPCGSVFLPILLASTVAATLTVGGMLMVQSHSRASQIRADAAIARINALSAIEIARARIASDIYWRTNNANGIWLAEQQVTSDPAQGSFSVSVTNPFGALSRSDSDHVLVTGTGRKGQAYQTTTVRIAPGAKTPLTCLNAAICAAGTITLAGTGIDAPTGIVASNADIIAASPDAKVQDPAQAVGIISGKKYNGATTAGAAALAFPDASQIAAFYPTATPISPGSLTVVNGNPAIQLTVLSPATNPYGATNARGIYTINCGGGQLLIQNCRIVGTLIVLNASLVTVSAGVVWEPAEAALPCLLVQGPLTLSFGNGSAIALKEDGTGPEGTGVALNFNPAGTPYPYLTGSANTNKTDSPTSAITGLLYCTGNATIAGKGPFHSLIAGGTLSAGNYDLKPTRDSTYTDTPPPGFYTTRQIVLQGTFR